MPQIFSLKYYFERAAGCNKDLRYYSYLSILLTKEVTTDQDVEIIKQLIIKKDWQQLLKLDSYNTQKDNLWIFGVSSNKGKFYIGILIDYYEPFYLEKIVYLEETSEDSFKQAPFTETHAREKTFWEKCIPFLKNILS